MGASGSNNLNIVVIASVLQCSVIDIENLILHLEKRPLILQGTDLFYQEYLRKKEDEDKEINEEQSIASSAESQAESLGIDATGNTFAIAPRRPPEALKLDEDSQRFVGEISYLLSPEEFHDLLMERQFNPSDISILINLYLLQDKRGFRQVDLRHLCIAASVLLAKDPHDCLEFTFRQFDRKRSELIDKPELLELFTILNDTLLYFGDRYLVSSQVVDLADSIYTSAGKLDGLLYYPNFIDLICAHPIVEMLLSPQFQGNIREKIFDEETLETMNLLVR